MSIVTPHATVLLEFSRDPLSDTSPAWVDITQDLVDVEWADGKSKDLDEPQAGGMTLRLKNRDRRYEPEYAAGAYYPDIVPLRRFRLSLNATAEFFGYAVSYDVTYPAGTAYSEVVVSCVDGFGLLSLDALDLLDPPSASSYEEVVMHDEPWGYWRLGEKAGAKVEAVTGPEGTYHNTPTHGAAGLIVGDISTATTFDGASSERARIAVKDVAEFIDGNAVSVEAWVKPSDNATRNIVGGPQRSGAAQTTWLLSQGGTFNFDVRNSSGTVITAVSTTSIVADTLYYVAGTWDGTTARIYVNGVLEGTATGISQIATAATSGFVDIANWTGNGYWLGTMSDVATYERALTSERVAAHYAAGTSGFPQQTAGARVSAVATSALWAETSIQTGTHDVQPVMEHGQSRLDEIRAAVKAEMPSSLFFFEGDGDPKYLGWEYKAAAPYNEPAVIFGDSGAEVPYQGLELVYDDDILNEVTVSHQTSDEGEASHTVTDTASVDEFYRRAHAESGLILVHHDEAAAVAGAILAGHKDPQFRVESLSLSGASTFARTQILTRKVGDCVRVKRRGEGGTPIDVITWILGRSLRLDRNGHLWATLQTARGFNASLDFWRAGMVGFSETGDTTVAA